ncbi:type VI secretion system ATPase TssH [Rubrimonas cliftonensis]|uniref:Type VI secretion system protein VasG n=1 Tax=Rubrimonas cliftonensis TaxID=89524 RepID=A0A1H3WUW8_9RHOB|nr:type VI secretion system ATPase TssH [Rubrimonas cliftonensis]SDZ90152.1 type VI secretion system protein VasG [Rubrimonas cliftonensis]
MTDVKALVSRLNPACRAALERAAQRCNGRGQAAVELEHLLVELLADAEGDAARLLRAHDVDAAAVVADLRRAIDQFQGGATRTPALSQHLVEALKEAWSVASLGGGADRVRSGHLIRAMLGGQASRRLLVAAAPMLAKLPTDLDPDLARAAQGGSEGPAEAGPDAGDAPLARFTLDMTAEARAGRIDPVVGRDDEIRQLVDILLRRRQNNPILAGDAGVGKTAVVEGLALRMVEGRVPASLAAVRLLSLDLGALQAGAGMRGEFEHRLRGVVDAVAASPQPIVLFIDEAHTLIGAGGQAGQNDAANLLKPALARGQLRCVAATTWGEYKRHIEKDPALARRFQVVKVGEPEPDAAVEMLRGVAAKLEAHHGVRVLEGGLREAVRLSHRYISDRQLPDKAISVLDTACARVAVSQSEHPPALAGALARIAAMEVEIGRLARETSLGDAAQSERAATLDAERDAMRARADEMRSRWRNEREVVRRLLELEAAAADRVELRALRLQMETLQEGREPLVHAFVDARAVAQVVSGWTGVPTGEMLREGAEGARDLLARLRARVIAQDGALETICRRVQSWFAQLGEPARPTGVFLLVGPSGVGKTETAAALADALFGGPRALVTVNMSEYQEAHSISGLKGAPPGYVGHGRGGVMTEAVRRRPYSVLLLDEIEKAHRDVIELFYQVFDKGVLEDSEGQLVDFRNTLILLTSNVGAGTLADCAARGVTDPAALAAAIRPELLRAFPAAFLGRLIVTPYRPLGPEHLSRIAAMKLDALRDRLAANHGVALTWDRAVLDALIARATESESGARNVEAVIADTLTPQVAGLMLDRIAEAAPAAGVHVALGADGGFTLRTR